MKLLLPPFTFAIIPLTFIIPPASLFLLFLFFLISVHIKRNTERDRERGGEIFICSHNPQVVASSKARPLCQEPIKACWALKKDTENPNTWIIIYRQPIRCAVRSSTLTKSVTSVHLTHYDTTHAPNCDF